MKFYIEKIIGQMVLNTQKPQVLIADCEKMIAEEKRLSKQERSKLIGFIQQLVVLGVFFSLPEDVVVGIWD